MEEIIRNYRISSNLLVSPLPPQYDQPPGSPVHESITLAKNYVSELCERYEGNHRSYFSAPVTTGTTNATDTNHPASQQLRGGCDQPTCWTVHRP
ncbi:hypothetical protein J6590_024056 [Homalodisca vitripennis]|nr:hypothetical protein J6590_024056 [Homalodisca vitripennis]